MKTPPMSTSIRFFSGNNAITAITFQTARPGRRLFAFFFVATLSLLLFQSGCRAKEEKHYPLQAEVVSVDLPHRLIFVKHGEIHGLMPAMTMSYAIGEPKQAAGLRPGDKITADLVVSENRGRLENIVLVEKAKPAPTPASP